jgi:hypothetical protein
MVGVTLTGGVLNVTTTDNYTEGLWVLSEYLK